MVPFLREEMAGILKWAMRLIIQKSALKKADTPYKLYKIDINNKDNIKLKTDIKLTTSANEMLKKVPTHLHQGLKDLWVIFFKMVEKMQEKSPIRYKLEILLIWIPRIWPHMMLKLSSQCLIQLLALCTVRNEFQPHKVIVLKSSLSSSC